MQTEIQRLFMFILKIAALILAIAVKSQAAAPSGSWFVGCYSDAGILTNYQDVRVADETNDMNTTFSEENAIKCSSKCATIGSANIFAIFSQTGLCLCSNNVFNVSGSVNNNLCVQKSCDLGNQTSDCDGESYHWLVNASTLLSAVKIVTSGILHGSMPQNISITTVPVGAKATFTFDFGDGVSVDYISSRVISYVYSKSRYYKVTVSAESISNSAKVSTSKLFQVETAPYGINISTPLALETEVDHSYTVAIVEGNNITVGGQVSIGGKDIAASTVNDLFTEDANIVTVGASSYNLMRASNVVSSPNLGIYIMPQHKFPTKGLIAGFEVYVTKIGYLRFQAYRPFCPTGVYCYTLNGCNATCTQSVDMMTNITVPTISILGQPPNYTLISEISFYANATGLKYFKLKSTYFEVEKGDIIGLKLSSSEGDIGHRVSATAVEYHVTVTDELFPGMQVTTKATIKNVEHMIRAHLSTTSTFKMKARFEEPGVANIKINAKHPIWNDYPGNQLVQVQERISGFKVTKPEWYDTVAYEVNKMFKMTTEKTKGSNITYEWLISQGATNSTYNNTIGTLDFTPRQVGIFWLFAEAKNLINKENVTMQFSVQERVTEIIVHNLTDGILIAKADLPINVMLTVVNGTNVTLKADFEGASKNTIILSATGGYNHSFQFPALTKDPCKKSTISITASNLIPGATVSKTVEIAVVCPIKGLTYKTSQSDMNTLKETGMTVNIAEEVELTINIDAGSFVKYNFNKDYPSGKIDSKDHSSKSVPSPVVFLFTYAASGVYTANFNLTNQISRAEVSFKVEVIDCMPEDLTMTGSQESSSPTMITRGMDYKVTGTTKPSNCSGQAQQIVSYKIGLYSLDDGSILELKDASNKDLVYIIPKQTRPAGKYKISFIQSYNSSKGPQVVRKNAFVTIIQTDLFAMIASGSSRQIPLKKRLTADANTTSFYQIQLDGSSSVDPDNTSSILTFKWFCRANNFTNSNPDGRKQVCNHTDLKPYHADEWSPKVGMDTKEFQLNATYFFLLKVMHGSRQSNYTQEISFLEGEPPAVEFECVTNCDTKWNIQEKIILRGKCPNCIDIGDIEYDWKIYFQNGSNVPGITGSQDLKVTSTFWNKQNLVINAGQLKDKVAYKVVLKSNYRGKAKITIITLERTTSALPHSGECEIAPKEGVVAETKFQIKCKKWQCIDLPLKYEFMTKIDHKESSASVSTLSRKDYPIWYTGQEPWNPENILPVGDPEKNFTVNIIVRIYNAYKSFEELKPIKVKVKNIDTATANATSVIESSKPKSNESAALSQWAASAASILNEKESSISEVDKEKVRANIIGSLSNAELEDIPLAKLKQLGEAFGSCVSEPDQLNDESQDIGSSFLKRMSRAFLSNSDLSVGAESLEQASLALIGPLSSMMSATTKKADQYLTTAQDVYSVDESPSPTDVTPTTSSATTSRPTKKQISAEADKTKKSAQNYLDVLDNVSEKLLRNKVAGETATVTKTDSFNLALEKKTLKDLNGARINTGDPSLGIELPPGIFNEISLNGTSLTDNETEISLQSSSMKKILQTWDVSNAKDSASEIESLKMLSRDYQGYNVSNLTSEITINILNRPEKLNTTKVKLNFPQEMKIRKEKIKSMSSPLLVEFGSPDKSSSNLTVLIQYGFPPTPQNYDAKLVITSKGIDLSKNTGNVSANGTTNASLAWNATANGGQPLARNSNIRVIDGKTIIMWDFANFTYGSLANGDMYFNFFYSGNMPAPILIPNEYTFDILELRRARNYTLRTFSCSCLYWSKDLDKWTDDGCRVDPYKTNFNKTVCKCNHLTSFGGFYVKPRAIPALSADMFLKGYVLFVAVTVSLLFFVLGLILARRADKKDLLKVGVSPLPDNNPDYHYLYQITVWTGLRRNAGTHSNVYFILSGDKGDTRIRHLKDPERKTFQKNSSDVFVFSTESSLGDLSHLRIWHDNTGGGWYLRKMVITDIQTDKTYQFLCNRWLAVDHDDGQIEMVAPVSGNDDLKDFNYVFMAKTRNDLSDAHLWFSLYARPPRSPFTRCQRLACCMSLLMTSMMTSAMFYDTYPKPTPETANYAAGLTFTWKQVYVAIISAAITVPVNIIIVTLFRSSKPKDIIEVKKKGSSQSGSKASLADNDSLKSSGSSLTLNSPESPVFNQNSEQPLLLKNKNPDMKSEVGKKSKQKDEKKKESYLFPYWCIYIGWTLTTIAILSSSVVVIIYGMVFGNSTSLEWLSSIILGFIQDIIVIQPIKIFLIAIFFAAIIKKVQDERPQVEEQGKKLAEDEEWLHTHADTSLSASVDTTTLRPPKGLKLDAMRELRFKERKMYAIVREILLYTFFVMVTFSISYSLREQTGFWQTNGLERLFNLPTNEVGQFEKDQFSGVLSYNDFWKWSEDVLVGQLFPTPWYSNNPTYPQRTKEFPGKLFINDLNHKIVNGVRLRQVRVKPDSCKKNGLVEGVVKIDCAAPYGIASEDKSNAMSNWTKYKQQTRPPLTRSNQPWLYQKWDELDGYPFMAELTTYFGGGYTQELFPRWPNKANIDRLKKERWLDRHTRAVIVEFALFNPSTNHFSMVTITFEFAATGGCIHYYSIYTFKLYRYTTGFAFFTIVCEVLFLLLLLLYMYREFKEWYQLRSQYFRQFWNLVEVLINILSLVAIGFYFYRQKLADDLLRKLPSKKPQTFINFQFAAYIDQIFIYVVSLIVFFVSIKFVKLLRFNRRMSILAETLKDAWYPLGMFSIVMGIVLTSTFAFATIVFGRQMYGYRNMLVTAATQISLLLGKFNFYEYQDTNRVIGPIFFLLYIIMVNWILLNMFLSIINDSYEIVSSGLTAQENDYEIVDFVMDQFKAWLGRGKTRRDEIQQNIRWQSAKKKMDAVRAFSASSTKKGVHWGDDDVLSGLTRSAYWRENPSLFEKAELDSSEIKKTVDRFIECINLLYFDDAEVAEKMSKKVKQEISNFDFLEQQKKTNMK